MPKESRASALAKLREGMSKSYGSEIYATSESELNRKVIPTGIYGIDKALGTGGVVKGLMLEVFGRPETGKTTLAIHIAKQHQKEGLFVLYIDAEKTFNLKYAMDLGIDTSEELWHLARPKTLEDTMTIIDSYLNKASVIGLGCVIIDTVAALTPTSEFRVGESKKEQNAVGHGKVGELSQLMSRSLNQLNHKLFSNKVTFVLVNQVRSIIGRRPGTTTPGGNAMHHYAMARIELRRVKLIKGTKPGFDSPLVVPTSEVCVQDKVPQDNQTNNINQAGNVNQLEFGDDTSSTLGIVGSVVIAEVVKNKAANPFKQVELKLVFGSGYDLVSDVYNSLIEEGALIRNKGVYRIAVDSEEQIVVKDENDLRNIYTNNPVLYSKLLALLYSKFSNRVSLPIKDFFGSEGSTSNPEITEGGV